MVESRVGMMGEEVEEEYEMCVGHQCFLRPHALYLPPPYYERIPHRVEQCLWFVGDVKILGCAALQPVLELLPNPMLSVKREFKLAGAKLTVQANFEANDGFHILDTRRWMLHVDWHPADTARVRGLSVQGSFPVKYSRALTLTEDCKAVASAVAELPSNILTHGVWRFYDNLPVKLKFHSLKISQIIGTRPKRDPPLSASSYVRAAKFIGRKDVITVVPGHWIDPGVEAGAPGERDFNLETLKGIPVLEIHGQGSTADYRGLVLGVIGNTQVPLNKELALHFGYFQMDWSELGVPRRGGVIVECFNADEVLQMAPWHRKWAARRLANRIVSSIERASLEKRIARGVYVDLDPQDDLVQLDRVYFKENT